MDPLQLYIVDAFTDRPFGGNPAGVVKGASVLDVGEMQLLARELNLSETAFILPPPEGSHVALRFFTPTTEVDICGHATLASLWILAQDGVLPQSQVQVSTRVGPVTGRIFYDPAQRNGRVLRRVLMDFSSARQARSLSPEEEDQLALALGLQPRDLATVHGLSALVPPALYHIGIEVLLVPVANGEVLYRLRPPEEELASLCRRLGAKVVYPFTLPGSRPFAAAEARMFAPLLGIREEAATGTAAACLARYLLDHGFFGPSGPGDRPLPHELKVSSERGGPGEASSGYLRFSIQQGDILGRPSSLEVEVEFFPDGLPRIWVGGACRPVVQGRYLR